MRLSLSQIDILQRWVGGDDNNAGHWSYLILPVARVMGGRGAGFATLPTEDCRFPTPVGKKEMLYASHNR